MADGDSVQLDVLNRLHFATFYTFEFQTLAEKSKNIFITFSCPIKWKLSCRKKAAKKRNLTAMPSGKLLT